MARASARCPAGGAAFAEGPDVAPVIEGIEEDLGRDPRHHRGDGHGAADAPAPAARPRGRAEDLNDQLDTILTLVLGDLYPRAGSGSSRSTRRLEVLGERFAGLEVERLTAPRSGDVAGFLGPDAEPLGAGVGRGDRREVAALEAQRAELERRREACCGRSRRSCCTLRRGDHPEARRRRRSYQVNGVTIVEAAVAFEVVPRDRGAAGGDRQGHRPTTRCCGATTRWRR
jgi:hypothetical protein